MTNLKFITGDLFTSEQPAIGHGVNIRGVMGSGIAPLVRAHFPAVFPPYKAACDRGELEPGDMLPVEVEENKWVFNLASQDNTGRNARLEWVDQSLISSFEYCLEHGISGFAIPRIGAGVGGLNWKDVKEVIINVASDYPIVELDVWSLPDAID